MANEKAKPTREELLEDAEKAIDSAFTTGKKDRATITQAAQLEAEEAVAMVGIAMEADEEADEATRLSMVASQSGDRAKAKAARIQARSARKRANAEHKAATKSARQAYNAIKFSAPNKMGFMRVVQIIFGIHIFSVIVYLLVTSRDTMTYSMTTAMDWIMVILESVAFWMFLNRYKVGRPFTIGIGIVGLLIPAIVDTWMGKFNLVTLAINGAFYIFLILYFALSKRVKNTLVNDIRLGKGDYDSETFTINRKGWPFYRNLLLYFIVFSNIGHWMEMGMCQLIIAGVVRGDYDPTNTMLWRDWLFPFPMEGIAVVCIALFLYPLLEYLKKRFDNRVLPYVISFFANALFCSIVEFTGGIIFNADHQWWDYSAMFCNIMGQVCLQNALAFGVAASLITWFVYPAMERWIARVPYDVMNIVFIVVLAFGVIVWSLYIIPGFQPNDPSNPENIENVITDRTLAAIQSDLSADDLDSWQEILDSIPDLTAEERAAIEERLDVIRNNYNEITEMLDADIAEVSAESE